MYILHQDTTLIGASEELLEINAMLDNPLTKKEIDTIVGAGAPLLREVCIAAEAQGFTLSSVNKIEIDQSGDNYDKVLLKDANSRDIEMWHRKHEQIAIIWSVDDVMQQASDEELTITRESAMDLLIDLDSGHDACYGICWDTISDVLYKYVGDDEDEEDDDGDEDE